MQFCLPLTEEELEDANNFPFDSKPDEFDAYERFAPLFAFKLNPGEKNKREMITELLERAVGLIAKLKGNTIMMDELIIYFCENLFLREAQAQNLIKLLALNKFIEIEKHKPINFYSEQTQHLNN